MNTPITPFPFEASKSSKAKASVALTFQGTPKFRPDEFELRSDFNNQDDQDKPLDSRILQSAGLRTIDFWAYAQQ